MLIDYGDALISTRTALLGVVTSQLRFVTIDQDEQNHVKIAFCHDGQIDQQTYQSWQGAISKIHQFLDAKYQVETNLLQVDYPVLIAHPGRYAYFRMEQPDRVRAILALQRALWGKVSSAMRASMIEWANDGNLLLFYYDGEVTPEDKVAVSKVVEEVEQMYPRYRLNFEVMRFDYPKKIPERGELVYKRYESLTQ